MRTACCLSILAMSVVFFVCSAQLNALSDEEVKQLAEESTEFGKADNRVQRIWNSFSEKERSKLRSDQNEWLKNGRDADAAVLMKRGESKESAYTKATKYRADYLLWKTGRGGKKPENPAAAKP
jgi:hypothetical protein